MLTEDVRYLGPADRRRILGHERRVVGPLPAPSPPGARAYRGRAGKPLTMLLFGMISWMFIWLKPDGDLTHETMAPIVADLFFASVPAFRLSRTAGEGRSRARRAAAPIRS